MSVRRESPIPMSDEYHLYTLKWIKSSLILVESDGIVTWEYEGVKQCSKELKKK